MIWCVEDDASIRDIEVYALQSTGFEAKGFEDGQVFWDALQKESPELVILDVMLPGLDGIELLRRMKAVPAFSSIPVVMATAKGAEYDKIQGLDLGADYYLVKPFGVMELVSCVKAVLRRCQPQKASSLLQSGGIAFGAVRDKNFVAGQRHPARLIQIFIDRFDQERIAALRAIAAKALFCAHFQRGGGHGARHRRRQRARNIADAQADHLILGVGTLIIINALGHLAEQVSRRHGGKIGVQGRHSETGSSPRNAMISS